MQLLLLGLIAALLVHDEAIGGVAWLPSDTAALVAAPVTVVLGKLFFLGLLARQVNRAHRELGTPDGHNHFRRLERWMNMLPFVLLGLFIADLSAGWLVATRALLGNTVVLDELIALLPTVLTLIAAWWVYYPVDRRLREATIFRRADQGLPLYPVWTRPQYLFTQLRNQVLILLVPLLVIIAWSESLQLLVQRDVLTLGTALWATPVGACVLFLFAPTLLRHLFDTVPLPPGSIRDALQSICDHYGVGVRDLLLWRTGGHLINAAVMGLVAPLRYVLMSDGLLDQLHQPHVEAVMAHELGHVKHHHLVWLVLAAAGTMSVCFGAADLVMLNVNVGVAGEVALAVGAMVLWALGFGWVSRRVERQADTFAAKHMSRVEEAQISIAGGRDRAAFTEAGVQHVITALQRVAELNHASVERRSWRHGSIASRQRYLATLIGRPLNGAGVDRVMLGVKLATALILGAAVTWMVSDGVTLN